jgi:glycosyltransferase involved in cell wall biosynthesis
MHMLISVVTPAHNEEVLIEHCVASVTRSATHSGVEHEHIVVINRCTDRTEQIATQLGCRIVHEDARNLSRIRNAGVEAALGSIIVTIDADSIMTPNMLGEVSRRLESGKYVGGGVRVMPERWPLGIVCSLLVVLPFVLWHRVSAGMFWCFKRDFEAIGGFDETLARVEDIDFGTRLRTHGKNSCLKYGTIRNAKLITSCRKFDQFGDWYFVRHPNVVWNIFRRKQTTADGFYYDARTDRTKA